MGKNDEHLGSRRMVVRKYCKFISSISFSMLGKLTSAIALHNLFSGSEYLGCYSSERDKCLNLLTLSFFRFISFELSESLTWRSQHEL